MNITISVNGADLTASALLPSTRIKREISGRVSTAELEFRLAVADVASVAEANAVEIRDAATTAIKFKGTITRLARDWFSPDLVTVRATCADFTPDLESIVIPSATFTNQSDRAIFQSLVSTYAPGFTATNANIAVLVANIPSFVLKDTTLKQAFDDLCKLTTGEYFLDFSRGVHYIPGDGSTSAPFSLSTSGGTPFALDGYSREFSRCVNSCTVLGGVVGGSELRVTYEDPVSIAAYGKHSYILIDRDITIGTMASLKAQAMVEANAYPREMANATVWADGLDVGQTISVTHAQYDLAAVPFLVRTLETSWNESGTVYTVELGDPAPTTERLIAALDARSKESTSVPSTVPSAGSVTDASIAPGGLSASSIGSVNASSITGVLTAGQISSVNAAAILGTISSGQIGSVNAATVTGLLSAGQIGSVNATSINGVIVSSQVANDLIDSLAKLAPALRPIPQLTANPTTGATADWPANSVYYNTTASTYRKLLGGTWVNVDESSALSGKFQYSLIGTLKASSITGLIAAAQIGSITAGQITGQLAATQIGSVSASSITGSISASSISGGITAQQISSIYLGTATDGVGKELLPNTTFSSSAAGWTNIGGDPHQWHFVPSGDRSTGNAGAMRKDASPGLTSGAYAQVISDTFAVNDNEEFEHSGWYWTENGYTGAFYTYLHCYDAARNYITTSHTAGPLSATAQSWRRWLVSGRVPTGTRFVNLSLTLWDNTAGAVYVDDISLRRVVGTSQVGIAAIQAQHIASVSAATITGTISASQIGTVNASSITGTLSSSQIGTINATQISGTLNASQIGTITASQIGSINAATITIGLVQNGQIQGISADKLTAGTITATVRMTSPQLDITSGTFHLQIDATNKVKIADSAGDTQCALTQNGVTVSSVLNPSGVTASVIRGGFTAVTQAGSLLLSPAGLSFGATTVVRSQYPSRPVTLADVIALIVYHGLSA